MSDALPMKCSVLFEQLLEALRAQLTSCRGFEKHYDVVLVIEMEYCHSAGAFSCWHRCCASASEVTASRWRIGFPTSHNDPSWSRAAWTRPVRSSSKSSKALPGYECWNMFYRNHQIISNIKYSIIFFLGGQIFALMRVKLQGTFRDWLILGWFLDQLKSSWQVCQTSMRQGQGGLLNLFISWTENGRDVLTFRCLKLIRWF